MLFIVLAVVFLFFGLTMFLAGSVKRNSEKKFDANAFETTGIVISRKLYSDGPMSEYYIRITDKNGVEQELLSQSFKPLAELQPGTPVRVAVAEKTTLGIASYEMRVVDERFAKPAGGNVGAVLTGIAVAFFVAAAVMIVLKFVIG